MTRNLVICSDGTGNTFQQHVSNVSRLVQALDLTDCDAQLVFYDQGIGTNPHLVRDVKSYKEAGAERKALEILDPPKVSLTRPLATLAGLTVGYGLYANLQEMYQGLAKHHRPGDNIFLFGFSRGAFTVRAFAGLLYRCGVPAARFAQNDDEFRRCFAMAYAAYEPHREDQTAIDAFRKQYDAADAEVHFLGIWDTVKSYGGIRPRSLPHLRHNPIVRNVCHALALNEHRSWFLPTSWGGIESDARNASTIKPDRRYESQCVQEVWFTGCHSDIGGGDDEAETAKISFRWIVGAATDAGLRLDPRCDGWIFEREKTGSPPEVHESYNIGWWFSDWIPRWELDNHTRPPGYPFKWTGNGMRAAEQFRRKGKVCFHSTTGVAPAPGVGIVQTSLPRLIQDKPTAARSTS